MDAHGDGTSIYFLYFQVSAGEILSPKWTDKPEGVKSTPLSPPPPAAQLLFLSRNSYSSMLSHMVFFFFTCAPPSGEPERHDCPLTRARPLRSALPTWPNCSLRKTHKRNAALYKNQSLTQGMSSTGFRIRHFRIPRRCLWIPTLYVAPGKPWSRWAEFRTGALLKPTLVFLLERLTSIKSSEKMMDEGTKTSA